jgi:hypothetical protein
MKALVVFESMFGNTEAIARAVVEGLSGSMQVDAFEVAHAPGQITGPYDLIVAGGPTHAFSLSRPSTRKAALEQGATHGVPETGLREWLGLLRAGPHSEVVAVFDTRVEKVRRLPGSAANKAARLLHDLGYTPAGKQSFYVSDTPGPLIPGEIERAKKWGERLASQMVPQAASSTGS